MTPARERLANEVAWHIKVAEETEAETKEQIELNRLQHRLQRSPAEYQKWRTWCIHYHRQYAADLTEVLK